MRRIKRLISLESLKHIVYIPKMMIAIENWLWFLLNYAGFINSPGIVKFRDGTRISAKEMFDFSTIAVIFIKNDYGHADEDSVIIDIGANIGAYSIFAAKNSSNTKVYSYEPYKKTFDLLRDNIRLNRLERRIKIFNLGVSSKNETRKLYLTHSSVFNSLYPEKEGLDNIKIRCVSLADIFKKNRINVCDILKMDCEGAEFEIIYGAPDSCLKRIRKIYLEFHNQDKLRKNIDSLLDFLNKKGFKVLRMRKDNNEYSGVVCLENGLFDKHL